MAIGAKADCQSPHPSVLRQYHLETCRKTRNPFEHKMLISVLRLSVCCRVLSAAMQLASAFSPASAFSTLCLPAPSLLTPLPPLPPPPLLTLPTPLPPLPPSLNTALLTPVPPLPPSLAFLSSLDPPLDAHHVSASSRPPSPPPTPHLPRHCWSFSLQFNLTLSSLPSSKLQVN